MKERYWNMASLNHYGKGSRPRPMEISRKEFVSNWDRIFGKGNTQIAVPELPEPEKKVGIKRAKKKS
jgi:hypothetical protein